MAAVEYQRPYLYDKQLAALFHNRRWGCVEASTKSGKTVGCIAWLVEQAFAGKPGWNYWWVSPGYNQSDIAFRRIKAFLTPGTFTPTESPTPKITLLNGCVIWFKSGDNADALYGEDVYAAVIDEASRVKEDCWHAVYSTLTATGGPCRIIGNVKGRKNWFYTLSRSAESAMSDPNSDMWYAKITAPDAIEAGVIAQDVVTAAERMLPEAVYRELYLAEPADDGGNPFGLSHIGKCTQAKLSTLPPVAYGIDLAKKHDYLVVIGLDANGNVCQFQRWKGVPWGVSVQRIWDIVGEDVPALVDSTGIGDMVVENLQQGHGNFQGYTFSQNSKQKLMEGLAVAIQSQAIGYPPGPIVAELESFEYEYTRTGVRYTAPSGAFDDCVCALALANHQFVAHAPGEAFIAYMNAELEAQRAKAPKPETLGATIELDSDDLGLSIIHGSRLDDIPDSDQITNELTELYERTVNKWNPRETTCHACAKPIGPTRVSDGEFVWHPECSGHRHKALAA